MTTASHARLVVASAAALLAVASLAGCTATNDLLNKSVTTNADSREDMAGSIPAWIPEDATDIRIVSGSESEASSILLTSSAKLDPATCAEVPRISAPTMEVEGAPDVYDAKVTTVYSCGDWTVAASPDGWYGWTPATEDEAAPTTTPAS